MNNNTNSTKSTPTSIYIDKMMLKIMRRPDIPSGALIAVLFLIMTPEVLTPRLFMRSAEVFFFSIALVNCLAIVNVYWTQFIQKDIVNDIEKLIEKERANSAPQPPADEKQD